MVCLRSFKALTGIRSLPMEAVFFILLMKYLIVLVGTVVKPNSLMFLSAAFSAA